ncbi:unnamed protein product [Rotaria sordida]|uniref:ADP-ribosylglycohydrolase n=1 Tax=Rotaria sordida TaxID=392033 RepID=A0A814SD30_9BILA|nr:unnamed protein product [Rotaria sordida]CAF3732990.1 unnamed protein product [Rotaria sordida]
MEEPPDFNDEKVLDRIEGSMIGLAIGDALGAHVEFRSHQFLVEYPVTDFQAGGPWSLQKGQFTDDTSMALCLANSLVSKGDFSLYDQLVRYKWWFTQGYMSSTGKCFDIGTATSQSLQEFEQRQAVFAQKHNIPPEQIDYISGEKNLINEFDVYCSEDGVAGNGALMRLAPVPLFFYRFPPYAVEYSGHSGQITHGDIKAYDACRYYGALIVAALQGYRKDQLLDKQFYAKHTDWFSGKPLCNEVKQIAEGSYKKPGGYDDGIRGKGYIINALEAALWAFWSDENSFERGALAAVNLGDDTDTTAAIYGQLAGAYYGYKKLPQRWLRYVYAKKFMLNLSNWIAYEGEMWQPSEELSPDISSAPHQPYSNEMSTKIIAHDPNLNIYPTRRGGAISTVHLPEHNEAAGAEKYENPRRLRYIYSDESTNHPISSPTLPRNKERVKHHNMTSHFTFGPQSEEVINTASLNRPRSNIYSSQIEESFYPVNSINYSGKTPHDNKLHKLSLRETKSITTAGECAASMRTTLMQRPSVLDDKNSKMPVESSENITFSSRAPPQNPAPINHFNVNKHGDLMTREQNYLPQDTVPLPQSAMRNSKGTSSTSNTSQFRTHETPKKLQRLDQPMPDDYRSSVTNDKQTKDNRLPPISTADPVAPTQTKPKKRNETRSGKILNTDLVDSNLPSRRHKDKDKSNTK